MGTLPKNFRRVAKKKVVLPAEEKSVTTIPSLPTQTEGREAVVLVPISEVAYYHQIELTVYFKVLKSQQSHSMQISFQGRLRVYVASLYVPAPSPLLFSTLTGLLGWRCLLRVRNTRRGVTACELVEMRVSRPMRESWQSCQDHFQVVCLRPHYRQVNSCWDSL